MTQSYGAQNEHGILRRVLMHRPGEELKLVTEETAPYFGFHEPVVYDEFLRDFDLLVESLETLGAEVLLLTDVLKDEPVALDYIRKRPNITYTRDLAVVMNAGCLLMSMFQKGRKGDPWVIRLAMEKMGIPILGEIRPPGFVEGGGIMFLSERQMIVSLCDRTTEPAIYQMCDLLLDGGHLDEIIMVSVPEGTVHIDGLMMFLSPDLAVGYKPHLEMYPSTVYRRGRGPQYVWLPEYLDAHGFELIEISREERDHACVNYVVVSPLNVVGYDLAARISRELEKRGGRALSVPAEQLLRGNAGPHCMTCALLKN